MNNIAYIAGVSLMVFWLLFMLAVIVCSLFRCPRCGKWHEKEECDEDQRD